MMQPHLARPLVPPNKGATIIPISGPRGPQSAFRPITGGGGGGGGGPSTPSSAAELRRTKHNEKTKLRATGLNTIGVGFIVAGLITPLTALGLGTATLPPEPGRAGAMMLIWIIGALILHFGATLTLEALE